MNVSEIDAGKILQKLDNSGGRPGGFKTTKSDLINIQANAPLILDRLMSHLDLIPVTGSEKVSETHAKKKSPVKVGGRRRRRKSRKRNYTKKKQSKKKSRRRKTRRR